MILGDIDTLWEERQNRDGLGEELLTLASPVVSGLVGSVTVLLYKLSVQPLPEGQATGFPLFTVPRGCL